MDTHENYRKRGMGEGDPGNINPDEINTNTPDKAISETVKLERKESAAGINQSKRASSERLDEEISQIDEETKAIHQNNDSGGSADQKQFDGTDANRIDNRDRNDSSTEWNAEQNRTGREK